MDNPTADSGDPNPAFCSALTLRFQDLSDRVREGPGKRQ